MTLDLTLRDRQARQMINLLLTEALHQSPTAAEIIDDVSNADGGMARQLFSRLTVPLISALPEEQYAVITAHMARIMDRCETNTARMALTILAAKLAASRANHQAADAALDDLHKDVESAATVQDMDDRMRSMATRHARHDRDKAAAKLAVSEADLLAVRGALAEAHAELRSISAGGAAERMTPFIAPPARLEPPYQEAERSQEPVSNGKAPKLSTRIREFFAAKRYPAHTEKQNSTTVRLWIEIVGDKATDRYTDRDAYLFQSSLRQVPSSHGKGRPMTAPDAIEAARGRDVPLLNEKTIERHFSLMRQIWKHLGKRNANPDIFDGIEHKVVKSSRKPWSEDALDKLLRARWNPTGRPGNRVPEETHAWLVACGGYTGARVEELARLRPRDVQQIGGAWFFVIREQAQDGDGGTEGDWTPKTEDGERMVAIHPKLAEAGILALVAARRAAGEGRLFDLAASGPMGNLAVEYSRDFSRHKTSLKVGPKIVFHSFRHNVETILGSKHVRQEWVDRMMGHKYERPGNARKSVGVTDYFHGLDPEVLRETGHAVTYPDAVCPTLLLQRVRGEIPW